jgi:hypothetical protein
VSSAASPCCGLLPLQEVWHPAAKRLLAGSKPLSPPSHKHGLMSMWRHYEEVCVLKLSKPFLQRVGAGLAPRSLLLLCMCVCMSSASQVTAHDSQVGGEPTGQATRTETRTF